MEGGVGLLTPHPAQTFEWVVEVGSEELGEEVFQAALVLGAELDLETFLKGVDAEEFEGFAVAQGQVFGVGGGAALAAESSGFAVPKGFIGLDFLVAEAALFKRGEDAQLLGQFGECCAQSCLGAIFAVELGKGVE